MVVAEEEILTAEVMLETTFIVRGVEVAGLSLKHDMVEFEFITTVTISLLLRV
jgi:hypothetical protein